MRKRMWIILALLVVLPGLLMTVSCAKKQVRDTTTSTYDADTAAKQAEMERQKRLAEEKRLKEEALNEANRIKMAKEQFLNEDVYFQFDSAALLPDAQNALKRKAAWLKANADARAMIEGHCDERGTNEYNLALGDRRAESAKAFLVNLGISASRLATISYGEEKPVDSGQTEEAWAKNRRAHFILK